VLAVCRPGHPTPATLDAGSRTDLKAELDGAVGGAALALVPGTAVGPLLVIGGDNAKPRDRLLGAAPGRAESACRSPFAVFAAALTQSTGAGPSTRTSKPANILVNRTGT